MVKRILLLAAAFVGLATAATAQDPESAYAGIYRGKLPSVYPYRFNGTYFWFDKTFRSGDVMYNGRLYRDVSLNVDAFENELQVRPVDGVSAMVVFRDQVAWFTMGNTLFVNLRYLGWKEVPEGYYEVVRDGAAPLLRRVEKTLRFDSNGSGALQIGYEDPGYDTSIPNYFHLRELIFFSSFIIYNSKHLTINTIFVIIITSIIIIWHFFPTIS